MALTVASAHLSDKGFLVDFSTCELPLTLFHHGDHLRLAWIQLHRHPFELALKLAQKDIQDYAQHHGVPHISHETITITWVSLLATHNESSFAAFIKVNERSLCPELLHRFWTSDALNSNAARQG